MDKNRVHYMQGRQQLALAQRLDETADRLAGQPGGEAGFVREDAVAALRWSAAYLRRDTVRDEDLTGLLVVFRRILPDFDTLTAGSTPASHRGSGTVHPLTFRSKPAATPSRLRAIAAEWKKSIRGS